MSDCCFIIQFNFHILQNVSLAFVLCYCHSVNLKYKPGLKYCLLLYWLHFLFRLAGKARNVLWMSPIRMMLKWWWNVYWLLTIMPGWMLTFYAARHLVSYSPIIFPKHLELIISATLIFLSHIPRLSLLQSKYSLFLPEKLVFDTSLLFKCKISLSYLYTRRWCHDDDDDELTNILFSMVHNSVVCIATYYINALLLTLGHYSMVLRTRGRQIDTKYFDFALS